MNQLDNAVDPLNETNASVDQMFYRHRIDGQAERMEADIDRDRRLGERVAWSAIQSIKNSKQLDHELFVSTLNLSQISLASFLQVIQTELESYIGGKSAAQ